MGRHFPDLPGPPESSLGALSAPGKGFPGAARRGKMSPAHSAGKDFSRRTARGKGFPDFAKYNFIIPLFELLNKLFSNKVFLKFKM